MRNLRLLAAAAVPGPGQGAVWCGSEEGATGDERTVYACTADLTLSKYTGGVAVWDCTLAPEAPGVTALNVAHLALPQETCVGLSDGTIYTVDCDNTRCDLVATCQDGLLAMQWSPDQEVLVLVSKAYRMTLMSYMFEPLTEATLSDGEFGEKNFITVGWGKKETQFHGSEGKQAARAKVEVKADDSSNVDPTPRITWRGDGQLYAVGYVLDNIRRFKVFDKDGRLQYTSEKQPGLEANLSWRPSGNVIATTQKLPNKYVVAFFEKNGLKHGDFTIPVNSTTFVEEILWNNDSDILALKCFDSSIHKHSILLFTSSNYHWYLKQTLNYDKKISNILWDNNFEVTNGKKLHVFLSDGTHNTYSWTWNVDHSAGKDSNDNAVVGVIDGNKLLLTAFRFTVVPPPMSAFQIEAEFNINHVAFGPTNKEENTIWDSNSVCVFTDNGQVLFFKSTSKVPLHYELAGTVSVGATESIQNYNWQWLKSDVLICVKHENCNYFVEEYILTTGEKFELKLNSSQQLESAILNCVPHPIDDFKTFLETSDGMLLEYTIGGELTPYDVSLPGPCPKLTIHNISDKLYFLGLSYKNNLCVNDEHVMNNVSSIFVHSHFLLLTTLQHELLCTELTEDGIKAIIDYQKNPSAQVYKRKIERGAKLVVVVPNDTRTVLQLPRGNLETVQPRPLSLKIIGEYLDNLKYFSAFDLMRKQRINLNLIHDHNPEKLLQNINTFLTEIKNNSWLSLFLSDLENVDVTKTMYESSYSHKNGLTNKNIDLKIVNVCDTVRSYLEKRTDKEDKILPIITSYVKKSTIPNLESALLVVKELKIKEINGLKPCVSSDEALKYLLYLVDVNYLYEIALGMYDFDLVLLVANKSQKDPKDYIPMLNEFDGMEENFKRFSINKYLKRFSRAVESLAKCGPTHHEELITFVKYHSLYKDALQLFKPSDDIYKQIANDYGLHLMLKKQYTEAGFLFQRGDNLVKAVGCFKEALEWEFAIQVAQTWPKEQFRELCWDLATSLKEEKRHSEALSLLEQYYDDREATINYAVECGRFKAALRYCQLYQQDDLKETLVLPALLEEHSSLSIVIAANSATFSQQCERLAIVRTNKGKMASDTYDPGYMHRDSDLYSDAGSTLASTASRSSSRTFRSSKNRRKHERKLISLKEGSQYEDIALITALHGLVVATFDLRSQVKEVNLALCWFGRDKEAAELQNVVERLLKEMKEKLKEIWTHEFVLEATNASISAQNMPEGASCAPQGINALESHLRIAPVIQDVRWRIEGL